MEIPPHLMRLELFSLDQAALISAGLDPMQVGNCAHAAAGNWTGWEVAKANRISLLQAISLKKIRPVSATVWVSYNSFGDGEEEEVDVDTITLKDLNHLHDATFYRDDVLAFFGHQSSLVASDGNLSAAVAALTMRLEASESREAKLRQKLDFLKAEHEALLRQAVDEHTSRLEISREFNEYVKMAEANQPEKPAKARLPPLIAIAVEVFQEHWQGQLDPSQDVRARATQAAIVSDLRESHPGITNAVAKAIDKVASPIDRDPKNPSGKYQLRSS